MSFLIFLIKYFTYFAITNIKKFGIFSKMVLKNFTETQFFLGSKEKSQQNRGCSFVQKYYFLQISSQK